MEDLTSHIVDAFAVIGVAALVVLAAWVAKRKPAEVRPEGLGADALRDSINEESKVRQTAIQKAARGDDPSTALADLGNRRREP